MYTTAQDGSMSMVAYVMCTRYCDPHRHRMSHLDNPVAQLARCNPTSTNCILCAMPEHGHRDATAPAEDLTRASALDHSLR